VPESPSPDECCSGSDGGLLDLASARAVSRVAKALGDPARVRLLEYVARSPGRTVCACHLPAALGIGQPTVSHHMAVLRQAGLVDRERRGRWVHYRLRPDGLDAVRSFLELTASEGPRVSR
jgi:ArsR family transcriptional regulator